MAGDDFTLSGAALGFGTFLSMQKYYYPRYQVLKARYIDNTEDMGQKEKYELWKLYSVNYLGFLKKKKGEEIE